MDRSGFILPHCIYTSKNLTGLTGRSRQPKQPVFTTFEQKSITHIATDDLQQQKTELGFTCVRTGSLGCSVCKGFPKQDRWRLEKDQALFICQFFTPFCVNVRDCCMCLEEIPVFMKYSPGTKSEINVSYSDVLTKALTYNCMIWCIAVMPHDWMNEQGYMCS